MKRLTVLLITILYSISTLGIGLKEFYCCGKLKSITITFAQGESENCNKGSKKNGCCKNKTHLFKVKDTHLVPSEIISFEKYIGETDFYISPSEISRDNIADISISNRINSPPFFISISIYTLICNYRI